MTTAPALSFINVAPGGPSVTAEWYALHTRSRHEKKVARQLEQKGISSFVPTVRETHLWSDRRQVVEVPLFLCYVFVKVTSWQQVHGQVLRTPGLLRWVGVNGEPSTIPDSQIDAVRRTLLKDLSVSPYPFLKVGQKVRVRGGCLDGVEGILIGKDKNSRLVLSIDLIQQSLSVPVEGYDFEPA